MAAMAGGSGVNGVGTVSSSWVWDGLAPAPTPAAAEPGDREPGEGVASDHPVAFLSLEAQG